MSDLPDYGDAVLAVAEVLADLAPAGEEPRPGALPYIRVVRTGGTDDGITDSSVLDVTVFAKDAASARALAGRVRQRLTGPPWSARSFATAAGVIDGTTANTGPQLLPPRDPASPRLAPASYTVSMRRSA